MTEIVHQCPPGESNITPCCGKTPFELLDGRLTLDPELVTCPGHEVVDEKDYVIIDSDSGKAEARFKAVREDVSPETQAKIDAQAQMYIDEIARFRYPADDSDPGIEADPGVRQAWKDRNFAGHYGMGARKISDMAFETPLFGVDDGFRRHGEGYIFEPTTPEQLDDKIVYWVWQRKDLSGVIIGHHRKSTRLSRWLTLHTRLTPIPAKRLLAMRMFAGITFYKLTGVKLP